MPNYGLFRATSMNPAQDLSKLQNGEIIPFCTFSFFNPDNSASNDCRIYMRIGGRGNDRTCEFGLNQKSENDRDWCKTYEELLSKLKEKYPSLANDLIMINSSSIPPKQGSLEIHEQAMGYYTSLDSAFSIRQIPLGNVPKTMAENGSFVGDFGLKEQESLPAAARQQDLSKRLVAHAKSTLTEYAKNPPRDVNMQENQRKQKPDK